jgi:hypothetical protein
VALLVERLRRQAWWGQVVGPHGSGKSTLLAALLPELQRQGQTTRAVRLSQEQRRLPGDFWDSVEVQSRQLLIIDGFEQMGFLLRRRLKALCRRQGHGLVITSHRGLGLPGLYRTGVTAALACRVLEALLSEDQRRALEPLDISGALRAHRGNLREVFFELYDMFEERAPR